MARAATSREGSFQLESGDAGLLDCGRAVFSFSFQRDRGDAGFSIVGRSSTTASHDLFEHSFEALVFNRKADLIVGLPKPHPVAELKLKTKN